MTVDEPSLSRHDSASSKVDFDHRSTRLQKLTSSVRDQFTQEARGRILENPDQVFEQNAWYAFISITFRFLLLLKGPR